MLAHNTFALPTITTTVGILDWTIKEINDMDIKTRNFLALSGHFHPNSDVDRLYINRKAGGRGLKSLKYLLENRIISLRQHLNSIAERSEVLKFVYESELNNIIRVGGELLNRCNLENDLEETPKEISKKFYQKEQEQLIEKYKNKKMHGYFYKKLTSDESIDTSSSNSRSISSNITSHFEGYLGAIQDQEIPTKFLINKRQQDSNQVITCNKNCRLCKSNIEDVNHIISSCPQMSMRYYLPIRHDVVAKNLLKAHIQKHSPTENFKHQTDPEYIYRVGDKEYWWNLSIQTATKVPHNKPDIIIWDRSEKTCSIVEISCPADVNISKKVEEKLNNYGPLVRNMQIMYPEYKFSVAPIIVGALGFVPKCLSKYLRELGFNNTETKRLIRKLQNLSVCGTVKICKTFLRFRDI